jgi:hypothetical protein
MYPLVNDSARGKVAWITKNLNSLVILTKPAARSSSRGVYVHCKCVSYGHFSDLSAGLRIFFASFWQWERSAFAREARRATVSRGPVATAGTLGARRR